MRERIEIGRSMILIRNEARTKYVLCTEAWRCECASTFSYLFFTWRRRVAWHALKKQGGNMYVQQLVLNNRMYYYYGI